jgi:hypothetical protein
MSTFAIRHQGRKHRPARVPLLACKFLPGWILRTFSLMSAQVYGNSMLLASNTCDSLDKARRVGTRTNDPKGSSWE